jgi:hypothetical protein
MAGYLRKRVISGAEAHGSHSRNTDVEGHVVLGSKGVTHHAGSSGVASEEIVGEHIVKFIIN